MVPDDETLRAILDGMRHGDVWITADRCQGDSRAVNAFCDLIRCAPALAAEVLRLRAIIEGRPTPPTPGEIGAHDAAGGRWRCVVPMSLHMSADAMHGHAARMHIATLDAAGWSSVWWALDSKARPCVWPVGGEP